jgi:hypothetical protein
MPQVPGCRVPAVSDGGIAVAATVRPLLASEVSAKIPLIRLIRVPFPTFHSRVPNRIGPGFAGLAPRAEITTALVRRAPVPSDHLVSRQLLWISCGRESALETHRIVTYLLNWQPDPLVNYLGFPIITKGAQ